jgi:indole-3-glycerol phosphate synthase
LAALQTNSGTVLGRIVEARREEVARRKKIVPETVLRMAVKKAEPVRDFAAALVRRDTNRDAGRDTNNDAAAYADTETINVIAELKKASPSAGLLRASFDPAGLARGFEQAGACALSVLTEEEFFQGALAYMRDARAATSLPVLRKDFIVEPWQVWEARAANADSFLLIVAALEPAALAELLALARELGMEPLVEVHTAEELSVALGAGARIVGVNNRDLHTLEVRVDTSLELIAAIPDECIAVSESGLRSADDLARLHRAGFDAFLIGEHLMREADPAAALRVMLGRS